MTQARPPRPIPPVEPGGSPYTDLVPGDPPVPITVWRTPAGDDQATIPPRLATRLVSAYSRPGEAVVDLTDDQALTRAAADGARGHHRGWFTDAAAVLIAAATPPATPPAAANAAPGPTRPAASTRRRRRRTGEDADPPELVAWFGDDLTDPDLPPAGGAPDVRGADGVRGATSLVVGCWPLHAVDARNRPRLRGLLRAATVLLRPAGCLVLIVAPPVTAGLVPPEDFGPLVTAAGEAGLGYLQHIVAVRADVDSEQGDRFVYYATDDELLALARDAARSRVAHLRVHADLLVFTPRQAVPRAGGARG